MASQHSAADLLQIFAQNTDLVVFAFDPQANQFTFLNPAFEWVWRKSVMNNPEVLFALIHPEDKVYVQQQYQELLEGALVTDVEFRVQLRNKRERYICIKPHLTEDNLLIGYAQDVSGQKHYNFVLKKFSDKKNSILNILSHDLAGPLANIQALSKLLDEQALAKPDKQEVQKIVSLIERSSRQGIQLVQDLLKQEFLESAAVEIIKTRVDLVAKLKSSMDDYLISSPSTNLTFHLHVPGEPVYLEIDESKFMQAINNLISNAIKFTPDDGEITVALEEKEATILITVADTGVGIPAQYHPTLFDKFTRARRPGLKGEPSVGLGMSIIKTIVEWHQGQIWFESEENKGTTFYIEIPKY